MIEKIQFAQQSLNLLVHIIAIHHMYVIISPVETYFYTHIYLTIRLMLLRSIQARKWHSQDLHTIDVIALIFSPLVWLAAIIQTIISFFTITK
jgi:hypothetical protein